MKVLKNIALGALLVGASMGMTSAANAACGIGGCGYGWGAGCNTCARPCDTGCRLFSCAPRPACNTCNVCNTCRAYVPGRYVNVGCRTIYVPGHYVYNGF